MNRKRVRRLYRLEGLQLRMRVRRRKHMALHRGPAPTPVGPTERWSMDFVHDTLADGRPFRILTIVDHWSRHSPMREAGFFGCRVRPSARSLIEPERDARPPVHYGGSRDGIPIRALEEWAYRRGVQLDFIRPGKPLENAFIESFNGRLRDECLNVHQFISWRKPKISSKPGGSTIISAARIAHSGT